MVGLLATFLAEADGSERELEGPRDVKAFIGSRGGGIRLYREVPPPPGKKDPRKTGQIEIRLGRIREMNGTGMEDDDRPMPGPPGPRPGPPRPRIDNLDDVDFNVREKK